MQNISVVCVDKLCRIESICPRVQCHLAQVRFEFQLDWQAIDGDLRWFWKGQLAFGKSTLLLFWHQMRMKKRVSKRRKVLYAAEIHQIRHLGGQMAQAVREGVSPHSSVWTSNLPLRDSGQIQPVCRLPASGRRPKWLCIHPRTLAAEESARKWSLDFTFQLILHVHRSPSHFLCFFMFHNHLHGPV